MNIIKAIGIFYKYAQTEPVASVKQKVIYNRSIKPVITDINMTITDLSAAKSLMTNTLAINCANKIINYLSWYRTIGSGGNSASTGKQNLIPDFVEYNELIQTGLFGENFIVSLAALLNLNEYIPQFKTNLLNLEKTNSNM